MDTILATDTFHHTCLIGNDKGETMVTSMGISGALPVYVDQDVITVKAPSEQKRVGYWPHDEIPGYSGNINLTLHWILYPNFPSVQCLFYGGVWYVKGGTK